MGTKINETALKLADEYSRTEALGWYCSSIADLEYHIDEKIIKSPIEQIFFIAWSYGVRELIPLIPQFKVGSYFVDFKIDLLSYFVNHDYPFSEDQLKEIKNMLPAILIELDGHDWHERTKDQVERDKKRERFITMQGNQVFRFSGREVFKRPLDCVFEVRDHAKKSINSVKKIIWGTANAIS